MGLVSVVGSGYSRLGVCQVFGRIEWDHWGPSLHLNDHSLNMSFALALISARSYLLFGSIRMK